MRIRPERAHFFRHFVVMAGSVCALAACSNEPATAPGGGGRNSQPSAAAGSSSASAGRTGGSGTTGVVAGSAPAANGGAGTGAAGFGPDQEATKPLPCDVATI